MRNFCICTIIKFFDLMNFITFRTKVASEYFEFNEFFFNCYDVFHELLNLARLFL